ncbi:hypothetical protein A9W97_17500 [Mycobacterium gordonae]|nr:hypothetical protein A9W97_17500 [Mycobacterium gordonae]
MYGRITETRERRRERGFETVVISAVFDQPPLTIIESVKAKPQPPRTYIDDTPFVDYGICQLQAVPTT